MSRFDYIKYDELSQDQQRILKDKFEALELEIDLLPLGRGKATAITKLEEAYMWVGKAIRDYQIVRTGVSEPLEERKDG